MPKQQIIPVEPRPEQIIAVIDSREQCPLDVSPLQSVTGTLTTGDYSIEGLENIIAIERKSLPDFLACVGGERGRFEREVQRLLAYPVRALVIETTWQQLEVGEWRSKVTPEAAIGSALGWLLFTCARRRWRELRALVGNGLREKEEVAP